MNERQPSTETEATRVDRAVEESLNAPKSVKPTRRTVLGRGTKILVYTAPLVQLLRPSQALGATGYS